MTTKTEALQQLYIDAVRRIFPLTTSVTFNDEDESLTVHMPTGSVASDSASDMHAVGFHFGDTWIVCPLTEAEVAQIDAILADPNLTDE